ncbi:MAG: hypothetical protein AAFQ94_07005 [Bacteroidota bacterium]
MKAYKLNLFIQGVFVLLIAGILISAIFDINALGLILGLQFYLGISQYLGGWFLKFATPGDRLIKTYLKAASVNLILLFLIPILESGFAFAEGITIALIFIMPWSLALFYWYISFKNVKYLFFKKSVFQ